MAKKLSKRKNRKNWNKGLGLKQVSTGNVNDPRNRKGLILT